MLDPVGVVPMIALPIVP